MSLAISSTDSLFLRLLVPTCNIIESGELSSKNHLIWCCMQKILFSCLVSTPWYFLQSNLVQLVSFFGLCLLYFVTLKCQIRWFISTVILITFARSCITFINDYVNGSVDMISLSTVSIDWVDLVLFFSYWVILTSLFEWILLFSLLWLSLSLTTFSNKRVIMAFLRFSSSYREVISFSI